MGDFLKISLTKKKFRFNELYLMPNEVIIFFAQIQTNKNPKRNTLGFRYNLFFNVNDSVHH